MITASNIRLLAPILLILILALAQPASLTAQATLTTSTATLGANFDPPEAPTLASLLPDSSHLFAPEPYRPVTASPVTTKPSVVVSSREPMQHHFWDRENTVLFAATGAMATADFFATHANLANGGRELDPLARPFTGSTPLLATNFAMETAGVIGVSYLFHKTGHHTLERVTSFVNIGGSAAAVAYDRIHH
jgi:hypothetical protein